MPDELGDELRALFAHEDSHSGAAPDAVLSAVLAGAGRRRRSRTFLAVAASTVGALAIGGASWAVTSSAMRTDPVDKPVPVVTVTSSPEATASASPAEVADPYEGDLDGILADEYPDPAPERETMADNEWDTPVVYPDALVMEDWVWDRVGEGWSVATVGLPDARYPILDYEIPPAVLYLVSPEDVYFEVAELPEELWDGARVVSWDESEQSVRLSYGSLGNSGAVYDMRTGDWEEIVFASYGANAEKNEFVAADADGNELWLATSDNGTKLYRWDASTRTWAASALVAQAPDAFATQSTMAVSWFATSLNGDRVILYGFDDDVWSDIVVYSLTDDTLRTLDAPSLSDTSWMEGDWIDESTAWFGANMDEYVEVDLDDGDSTWLTERPVPSALQPSTTWTVGYGEATDGAVTYRDCGC